MNVETFGNARIFRPSAESEDRLRNLAKDHILLTWKPGVYREAEANNFFKFLYDFYDNHLEKYVKKLASRDTADFLLSQYDESGKCIHGARITDPSARADWNRLEPLFKRAIKYLVEMICLEIYSNRKCRRESPLDLERALICAESLAYLSQVSDTFHSILTNEMEVEILSKNESMLFKVTSSDEWTGFNQRLADRLARDRNSRARFAGMPQFDIDSSLHARFLDTAFKESHGASYGDFLAVLHQLISNSMPAGECPTLFLSRKSIISALKPSGLSEETVCKILDGFTITPTKMLNEQRKMWNPKQEHRALCRGFFQMPHETGTHVAFSRYMAQENLIQLVNRVCYQRLPTDWITPKIKQALAALSDAAGKSFEELVAKNMKSRGINGSRGHRRVGSGTHSVPIPDEVGEIDFLGYHPTQKRLILIEAKMCFTGLEARHWRDDLDMFVRKDDSYAAKFRKKIKWTVDNRERIQLALDCPAVTSIATGMVTLYPCVASEFIPDFPCISLTELMLDLESHTGWPYSKGSVTL